MQITAKLMLVWKRIAAGSSWLRRMPRFPELHHEIVAQ